MEGKNCIIMRHERNEKGYWCIMTDSIIDVHNERAIFLALPRYELTFSEFNNISFW